MQNTTITPKELEALKHFTAAWLKVYSFMPPEAILELFIVLKRISERYEAQLKQISQITITQTPTVSDYSKNIQRIAAQNQMINRNLM